MSGSTDHPQDSNCFYGHLFSNIKLTDIRLLVVGLYGDVVTIVITIILVNDA